jgi:pimeloyl-ACP methyl ester carboxylesterase
VKPEAEAFTAERDGVTLAGSDQPALEQEGKAATVVLAHGLTATRRYVVHGSTLLARRGHRMVSYDARGHGESSPAPDGQGYVYPELVADLAAVISARGDGGRPVLAGHSMGAHTVAAHALGGAGDAAAIVLLEPTATGEAPSEESREYWGRLADGLERDGVEGFIAAYDRGLNPEWRETLLRIARDRLGRHRHPEAVARALREVPVSTPFDDLSELERLDAPALVLASRDEADPSHPYAVAAEWAERLPQGRLVTEQPGESPLPWQGGKLSREIAAFCEEPAVRERLP